MLTGTLELLKIHQKYSCSITIRVSVSPSLCRHSNFSAVLTAWWSFLFLYIYTFNFFLFSNFWLKSTRGRCPRCMRGSEAVPAQPSAAGRGWGPRGGMRAASRAPHWELFGPHGRTDGPLTGRGPRPVPTGPAHRHRQDRRAPHRGLAPPAGCGPSPATAPPRRGPPGNPPRSGRERRLLQLTSASGKRGRSLAAALHGAPARSWPVTVSRGQQLCSTLPVLPQLLSSEWGAEALSWCWVSDACPRHAIQAQTSPAGS